MDFFWLEIFQENIYIIIFLGLLATSGGINRKSCIAFSRSKNLGLYSIICFPLPMALEETKIRITVDSETMHKNSSHKMWHKAEKRFNTIRVFLVPHREINCHNTSALVFMMVCTINNTTKYL